MEVIFTDPNTPQRDSFAELLDLACKGEVAPLQLLVKPLLNAQQAVRRLGALLDRTLAAEGADFEAFSVIHDDLEQTGFGTQAILSKKHFLQLWYCPSCRSEKTLLCPEHQRLAEDTSLWKFPKSEAEWRALEQFAASTAKQLNGAAKSIEQQVIQWDTKP
jgi:hypothetical protein